MSSGDGDRQRCCGGFCGFILTTGFVILIYWATFQPRQIRATVDSAALSNLTVVASNSTASSSSAVSYHLAVSLSLYNPSKRVNIYYDTLDAELRLRGDGGAADVIGQDAAAAASPAEFYQRKRSGNVVKLEFEGKGVAVPRDVAGELEKEAKGEAPVGLEMGVDLRVRYVFGVIKIRQKPRIRCWISVPVKPESRDAGAGGVVSPGDGCRVKY